MVQPGDSLTFLSGFGCLNELIFYNNEENTGDLTTYDLSRICPKLHSLTFNYRHANVSSECLDAIVAGLDDQNQLVNTINQNLRELNLHRPTLSSSYIDLLIKYSKLI